MDFIMVPAIIGIITLGIYKMFELFARRRERLAIIEKFGANIDAATLEEACKIHARPAKNAGFNTLKIACLLLGIGLGLLIGFFISYACYGTVQTNSEQQNLINDMSGIILGASTLLFGGLGLVVAFVLEMRDYKKQEK